MAVRDDPSFALARERRALIYLLQGRDEDAWQGSQRLAAYVDRMAVDAASVGTARSSYLPGASLSKL